jgi:hypothetical protein
MQNNMRDNFQNGHGSVEDNTGQGSNSLRLVVVVPDEQTHTSEGKQELDGYNENVYHNGQVLTG